MTEIIKFKCSRCDEVHAGFPDIAFQEPDATFNISQAEKKERVQLTEDTCILDDTYFFIRCLLLVKIRGHDADFGWGLWVAVAKENFNAYVDLFKDNREGELKPWAAWIANDVPEYSTTENVKARVHPQSDGSRPLLELLPNEHLLAIHQNDGMPLELAIKIAEKMLHQ